MSKAVLILDMPKNCRECNLYYRDIDGIPEEFCMAAREEIVVIPYGKPDWCPLKKLPDEKSGADLYDEEEWGCQFGWNYFRDTILGEVEYEL